MSFTYTSYHEETDPRILKMLADLRGFVEARPRVDFKVFSIQIQNDGTLKVSWACDVHGKEEEQRTVTRRIRDIIDQYSWDGYVCSQVLD